MAAGCDGGISKGSCLWRHPPLSGAGRTPIIASMERPILQISVATMLRPGGVHRPQFLAIPPGGFLGHPGLERDQARHDRVPLRGRGRGPAPIAPGTGPRRAGCSRQHLPPACRGKVGLTYRATPRADCDAVTQPLHAKLAVQRLVEFSGATVGPVRYATFQPGDIVGSRIGGEPAPATACCERACLSTAILRGRFGGR